MNVKINRNPSKASDTYAELVPNEAIGRSRFICSAIQSDGDVFISLKCMPSDDTTSGDWVQITEPVTPGANIYRIPMPVMWVASSDSAWVCSYVSGDM